MQKLFTAKVNALLAAFIALVFALCLAFGVFFIMRRELISLNSELQREREYISDDELAPIKEAEQYISEYFVGDTSSYSPVESAVAGMVDGLGDRWSYYVSPDEMAAYYENNTNSYVGIGVTVTKAENGPLNVESIAEDGGAKAAGIEPGDKISAVEGEDVSPWTLEECKNRIRGDDGTYVVLTVIKPDGRAFNADVERHAVQTVIVTGQMIGDIGYIALDNFNLGAADAFVGMCDEFINTGAKGFIFDMRFNGGGRLAELVDILDYLLPEGEIFRCVDKAGQETVFTSKKSCIKLPMAVLINDCSYSAAEYFAAALQQYGVAKTVGSATVGKGFAQNTKFLSDGSAIAISVFQYFTPNGESLAGVGLTPDYPVELDDESYVLLYYDQLPSENDPQLQKALDVVLK